MDRFVKVLQRDHLLAGSRIKTTRTHEKLDLELVSESVVSKYVGLPYKAHQPLWFIYQIGALFGSVILILATAETSRKVLPQFLARARGLFMMGPKVRIEGLPNHLPDRIIVSAHHSFEFRPYEFQSMFAFLSQYKHVRVVVGYGSDAHPIMKWLKETVYGCVVLPEASGRTTSDTRHFTMLETFMSVPDSSAIVVFADKAGIIHTGYPHTCMRQGIFHVSMSLGLPILDVVHIGPSSVVDVTSIDCKVYRPPAVAKLDTAFTMESYAEWRATHRADVEAYRAATQADFLRRIRSLEARYAACDLLAPAEACPKTFEKEFQHDDASSKRAPECQKST